MPATRKVPKNSSEFCVSGEPSLPPICGASNVVAATAIGIANK